MTATCAKLDLGPTKPALAIMVLAATASSSPASPTGLEG
jgi:hypothetical protein